MEPITTKVWSHSSLSTERRCQIGEVRNGAPLLVEDYPSLVRAMAQISFQNPELSLFYRGQNRDHVNGNGESSLMPAIYRDWGSGHEKKTTMERRFDALDRAVADLRKHFDKRNLASKNRVFQFEEVAWAILQHYEVAPTPLLDFTQSLRVAASFATLGDDRHGHLLVVGLPYPNGSISFYPDTQIINVRLLSICPPEAMRPFFQDGYLTGTFPHRYKFGYNSKLDFGRRLVAKFKLPKKSFWNDAYSSIPEEALYPANDTNKDLCDALREELSSV